MASKDARALEELPRKALVDLAKQKGLKANAKTSVLVEQLAAALKSDSKKIAPKQTAATKKSQSKAPSKGSAAKSGSTLKAGGAAPPKQAKSPAKNKSASPAKVDKGKGRVRKQVEELIDHDGHVLDEEAKDLAGTNNELLAAFQAKLEQHKKDLLVEVDARIQAAKVDVSPLLPAVELSTKRDNTPPSPFVEAMESGTRATASISPISPGKRKRARTVSIQEPHEVAPSSAQHVKKRARIGEEETQQPQETETKAPGIFSFFSRRTASGRQDVPPPPLSPGSQRHAPIGNLPFPLTAGASGEPPETPAAARTLFGTEREGDGARFGDGGVSPSRAWFGSLLGR